jgi:sialic acid synthase SpsE
MEIFKIPSGEITNLPYLKKVSFLAQEIILSTGMSTLDEIDFAIEILTSNKRLNKTNISILHCNTEYPTPYDDVNLNVLRTLKERYNTRVGYSDHTIGIEVPIAAVGIGAEIIEKHFTLDKSLPGPDQECSLNPEELINLVTSIRNIEKSFGTSEKKATKSEEKNKIIARRSIHINDNLQLGHVLTEGDLIMKRPGDGISPINIENILGKKIIKNLSKDHKLNYNDIE